MKPNSFTLGAFAIIFNEAGNVLLCHRRDMDLWNLPGGRVETGELPTESVKRETYEETGLIVEIERFLGVYGKASNPTDIVFTFICFPVGGKIILSDEADRIEYFDLTNLPENIPPNQVERIFHATNKGADPIFIRQTNSSTRQRFEELRK